MLLTQQHRRSARVVARMQETARNDFNEKVANGTMSNEELLNAPKCLRNFDEAEDAILEKMSIVPIYIGKSKRKNDYEKRHLVVDLP